jgi:acylphosphatase
MGTNVQAKLTIFGRVQGVCFRMETKAAADKFGVHGWVKNQSDGTVSALIEGDQSKVDAMIQWCKIGPPHAKVQKVSVVWGTYKAEFSQFTITY